MKQHIHKFFTILVCSCLLSLSLNAGTCTLQVNPENNGSCNTEYEEDENGNYILVDAWCQEDFEVIGGYNCIVSPY